jgi:hypothetical protein
MLGLTACGDDEIDDLAEEVDADDVAGDTSALETAVLGSTLPRKEPRTGGAKTISCNDVSPNPNPGACKKMIEAVADYYTRNSRGALQLSYTPRNGDFTINVNNSLSFSSMTVQSQYISTLGIHEFGHRLGLSHSTGLHRVVLRSGRTLELDLSTPMNGRAIGAAFLSAPEYYIKDWLPADEVALYTGGTKTYTLKQISDFDGKGESAVVIALENASIFYTVSWPAPGNCSGAEKCFIVHRKGAVGVGPNRPYLNSPLRELATESGGEFRITEANVAVQWVPTGQSDKIKVRLSRF